ncbi:GerAB/ArcD/ProY family transporter [Bacillaceae bacterium IKA-2]|nr:GerAB/ArcD/ProY family transporter [Bacillaceae bacterium IKA-2]
MNQNSYQISKLEMTITLITMIIGVGILTLPRALAAAVGTPDGWISIIISAVINMLIVYLIVKLHRNFPNLTFLQFICSSSLGKWIGKPLGIFFMVYFIFFLGFEARILSIVVKMYLLDRTPFEVTVLLIFLTTTYAVTKGVQGIIHLNLLFLPFLSAGVIILIIFNLPEAQFDVILPITAEGFTPILMGLQETIFSFAGVEILFFFLAFMKLKDMKAASFNVGIAIVTGIYVVIVLLSYTILSFESSEIIVFPLVSLAKEVELIEGVLERYDPLMITIWVMTIFNTMAIAHFLATKIVKDEFLKKTRVSTIAILITFLAFISTFIPNSLQETFMMGEYVAYLGLGLMIVSLLVGYLFVWFKTGSKKQGESEVI